MTSSPTVLPETHHGPHHDTGVESNDALEGGAMPQGDAEPALSPALAAALRLDRRVWLGGGAVAGIGALLVLGVPASALLPFIALGGCLGMHLFMGHGGHGGHEGHGDSSGDTAGHATHEGH